MAKTKIPIRKGNPRIRQGSTGTVIECPFCHPPHPLRVDMKANCGTILELKAVQSLYQNVKCALCGGIQGTMVKIGERYRHSYDCVPGHTIYTVPPKASRSAALFWRLPEALHKLVWRYLGRKVIQLSTEGKIAGHAWDRVEYEV